MINRRPRHKQATSFAERLALYAQEVRERAVALPPGEERAAFMKKLEQTEQAVRMSEWLDSPSQKAAPPLNKVP
jgi:hypothetical protein